MSLLELFVDCLGWQFYERKRSVFLMAIQLPTEPRQARLTLSSWALGYRLGLGGGETRPFTRAGRLHFPRRQGLTDGIRSLVARHFGLRA